MKGIITVEDKEKTPQCSICLSDFLEKESVIKLKCNLTHIFHEECIVDWIQLNFSCPLCREPILKYKAD